MLAICFLYFRKHKFPEIKMHFLFGYNFSKPRSIFHLMDAKCAYDVIVSYHTIAAITGDNMCLSAAFSHECDYIIRIPYILCLRAWFLFFYKYFSFNPTKPFQ